jgi:hypothetical protein
MPKKRWQDRDHIFNPPNITRLEICITFDVKESIPKNVSTHYKPRKARRGKVRSISIEDYLKEQRRHEG